MANENNYSELEKYIESAQASLLALQQKIAELSGKEGSSTVEDNVQGLQSEIVTDEGKVIEGAFDGQNMVGPDGKQYSVPANYASKSKLVEGDKLKLTIANDGSFIYKQIGPEERDRIVGKLTRDEVTGEFRVLANDVAYNVLLASITYFKGDAGDEIVILVPKDKKATWAAVENIIKQGD